MMLTDLSPAELSSDLREGSSKFLNFRRIILGLSFFSGAVMGGIALYQIGILKRIPEPRWRRFDAEKVNGSAEAYSHLATPDALLGLLNYSVTACLAGMGAQRRSATHPWIPISMAAKALLDAVAAGKLTVDEWTKYRAFCFWCLLTTTATLAVLPLAIPEARAAFRELKTGEEHA
jgi:uncharacterized membrane protein